RHRETLGAKGGEHLKRVAVGLHGVPRLLHAPVGADKEGRADHALAASRSVAPRPVRVVRLAVGIAQQADAKAVLLAERLARGGVVPGHTEHGNSERLELREVVGELARLGGAARRVVLRVEVHDVPFSLEVFGGDGLSFFVGKGKLWSLVAGLKFHHAEGRPKRAEATKAARAPRSSLKPTFRRARRATRKTEAAISTVTRRTPAASASFPTCRRDVHGYRTYWARKTSKRE